MKLRHLRKQKPYPKPYKIGASVRVPEYDGFLGMPMDTVRLNISSFCQSGPDNNDCFRKIKEARAKYLNSLKHD